MYPAMEGDVLVVFVRVLGRASFSYVVKSAALTLWATVCSQPGVG